MPLPRFERLAPEKQSRILRIAAEHFAADGPETASYNRILEAAGLSKASAYQYFDSRADLLDSVVAQVAQQLSEVLGAWVEAPDEASFRAQWRAGADRLIDALQRDPVLLGLAPFCLSREAGSASSMRWLEAVIANGQRIGVVRADVPEPLLIAASLGVLEAVDRWCLGELAAGSEPEIDVAYTLLDSLWRSHA